MKTLVLAILLLAVAGSAFAFTFTRWQVTSSEAYQVVPVANDSTVFWKQYVSPTESNIWAKNIGESTKYPLVERTGDKIPVSANSKHLLYHEYISETNWYDVSLFNLETGEDRAIASGPENQVAQDIWKNRVIYNTGDTHWPDLYLYDIDTNETSFVANAAIRPRIWGDIVVWMESAGGGYVNVVGYDLNTRAKFYIPDTSDGRQGYPDIWQDRVVWQEGIDRAGIFYKNLTTGEQRKISDTGESPVIWGDYIAWIQADEVGPYNIYAHNIVDGQTLKISDAPNGYSITPYIYGETLVWQNEIAGNRDIYAATFNTVPEPSGLLALCGGVVGLLAFRRRRK